VYFPARAALFGLEGTLLPCCWWGHESPWTVATANNPELRRPGTLEFLPKTQTFGNQRGSK